MNKILSLWSFVITFNIFIAICFTILVGVYNLSDTNIIDPIYNTTYTVADSSASETTKAHLTNVRDDFNSLVIPFDLIMFALIVNTYFGMLYGSIQSQKLNAFAFFSLLTFGSILMLLMISISIDVQDWIITELYLEVFEESSVATPLMDWFFANIGIISFLMAVILLIVNQIDELKILLLRLGGDER